MCPLADSRVRYSDWGESYLNLTARRARGSETGGHHAGGKRALRRWERNPELWQINEKVVRHKLGFVPDTAEQPSGTLTLHA